jgi:hypothetical protein
MKHFYYTYTEEPGCMAYLQISNLPHVLDPADDGLLLNCLEDIGLYESAEGMYETDFGFDVTEFLNYMYSMGIEMLDGTF